MPGDKKVEALDLQGLPSGGDSWTRTNDPIDVNDVLYQLCYSPLFGNFSDHILHLVGFRCFRGGSAQVVVRSTD